MYISEKLLSMKLRIISVLIICLFLASCSDNPFDYRKKYMGEWVFKVRKTENNTLYPGYFNEQDITYNGRIDAGSTGDLINIRFLSDDQVEIGVYKNNTYFNLPAQFAINFSADGYYTNFSWTKENFEAKVEYVVNGQRK